MRRVWWGGGCRGRGGQGGGVVMTRYVINSTVAGVYLGNCMGLGFWSQWDAVGQDSATVFESESAAIEHIESWHGPQPADLRPHVVPVECADERWATIAECVASGLERWTP